MIDNEESRKSTENNEGTESEGLTRETGKAKQAAVTLPEIPVSSGLDFESTIIGSTIEDRVKKRTSNILKLTEENEKLKAELKAITDRLEAVERRRREMARKEKEEQIREERS